MPSPSQHPRRRRWRLAAGLLLLLPAAGAGSQEVPAIVALVLDTSGSIRPELLARTRELSLAILEALPANSQVSIFTFDDQSRLILERTSDPEAIQKALSTVTRAGRFTALYDALYDASRYLRDAPPARKAILLVTDGKDENSALKIEDGLKVAQDHQIPVFAVGMGMVQEPVLRRIAKLTAGEYLSLADAQGAAIASRILETAVTARAPEAAQASGAPAAAPAPASPPPRGADSTLVWGSALVLLALAGAVAFAVLRRRKAPVPCPACGEPLPDPLAACPACGASAEVTEEKAVDEQTIVMRNPGTDYVEKTVLLRVRPSLTILRGAAAGQVFNLSMDTTLSLGRARTNDIALDDASVSSEHCRIRPEAGNWVLHDLQSTNGTFVNDKRVTRQALVEGDVIRIGETQLQFRMDQKKG